MDVGDRSRYVKEFRSVTVHGRKHANTEEGEEVFPGFPDIDEIIIANIAPRLPWTAFHILAMVSCAWRRAIHRHKFYDARVCPKTTQTLVAFRNSHKDVSTIALCSMEDGSCYHLPPIPYFGRIPRSSTCIFLDGRLYVLGGVIGEWGFSGANVFMFNVAGKRQWKQCASMKHPRTRFGCGIYDGKIYVFGGSYSFEPVSGSEMYDPKEDVWTPITPMPSFGFRNKVTTVGDELFVHSGYVFKSDFFERANKGLTSVFEDFDQAGLALTAEIYHPLKDEWRRVEKFNQIPCEVMLMVGEKLHRLSKDGMEVYDMSAGSWNDSKPLVFPDVRLRRDYYTVEPIAAVIVDDEILAMVCWTTIDEQGHTFHQTCLIRSQGVGGNCNNEKIVWQKLQCALSLEHECMTCPLVIDLIRDTYICPGVCRDELMLRDDHDFLVLINL